VFRKRRRNLVRCDDGRRTLRLKRGNTGVAVEIESVGDACHGDRAV